MHSRQDLPCTRARALKVCETHALLGQEPHLVVPIEDAERRVVSSKVEVLLIEANVVHCEITRKVRRSRLELVGISVSSETRHVHMHRWTLNRVHVWARRFRCLALEVEGHEEADVEVVFAERAFSRCNVIQYGAVIATFCCLSFAPLMYWKRRWKPMPSALSKSTPLTYVSVHSAAG